jgi:hypothetical protein
MTVSSNSPIGSSCALVSHLRLPLRHRPPNLIHLNIRTLLQLVHSKTKFPPPHPRCYTMSRITIERMKIQASGTTILANGAVLCAPTRMRPRTSAPVYASFPRSYEGLGRIVPRAALVLDSWIESGGRRGVGGRIWATPTLPAGPQGMLPLMRALVNRLHDDDVPPVSSSRLPAAYVSVISWSEWVTNCTKNL